MSGMLTLALAGNPNAGKTSIFNALTGSRHHVGNWPGKTVAKMEGAFRHGDIVGRLVDLPGTYSLSALSPEEVIARDYLLSGEADAVIDVVDSTNLERNLYLTAQLLELGIPLVLALNVSDSARAKGIKIDLERLERPARPRAHRRDRRPSRPGSRPAARGGHRPGRTGARPAAPGGLARRR